MRNEYLLLEREIEVIRQQQQTIESSLQQKHTILINSDDTIENGGNNTETMTGKTIPSDNSINTSATIHPNPMPIEVEPFDTSFSQWKGYGNRKRNRKVILTYSLSKRSHVKNTGDIFEEGFWYSLCFNKQTVITAHVMYFTFCR